MITKVYHALFGFAYKTIPIMTTVKKFKRRLKAMKKQKQNLEKEFNEGMLRLMASEMDSIYVTDDDTEKAAATLRLHRLLEDYNEMKKISLDDKKSKRELVGNIVAPTVTAVGGLVATGAWIIFEKESIVSGSSGKEILRQTISNMFKKK